MPVIFAPVVLQTFPDRCTAKSPDWIERARNDAATPPMLKGFADAIARYRDGSVPYIKLLDGGLVDNYGLAGFTIACGWRIHNYAAIGIWNSPRQWCRQA
jgi:NTE family protein